MISSGSDESSEEDSMKLGLISMPPLTPELKAFIQVSYKRELNFAEDAFQKRLKENKCPRARMEDFKILGQLASGGFATIFLVEHIKRNERYALKVQAKLGADEYKVHVAVEEKRLLHALDSRFVVKLHFAFQDVKNLYTVLEFASVGDLFLFRKCTFPDCYYKFFAAQIVLGLEYLHACKLVHKDIKPENVLVFADNYLKLADFGFCERCEERLIEPTGTMDYMAPDMFTPVGYGRAVDWWALGVVLYELRYKEHPYATPGLTLLECIVKASTVCVTFPETGDRAADELFRSFVGGLLEKDPSQRLGSRKGGLEELKNHKWFDEIDFIDVYLGRANIDINLWEITMSETTEFDKYDFLPGPDDKDPNPEMFKDF